MSFVKRAFRSIRKRFEPKSNDDEIVHNAYMKETDILHKVIVLTPSFDVGELITKSRIKRISFPSLFTSNENTNKENVTIVWYDGRADVKKITELIETIKNPVSIFSNHQKCLEYFVQNPSQNIFVILSGEIEYQIYDKLDTMEQIHSIYIYCQDCIKYEHDLEKLKKSSKLINIYTEYEILLKSLKENLDDLNKCSQFIDLFDQNRRSMKILSNESHDFNAFRAFIYVLLKTNYDREQAKNQMIEACRYYYPKDSTEYELVNVFEKDYQSKSAISCYTDQSFVYSLINQALRTEDYEALLTLRFYIVDLSKDLHEKYEHLRQRQQEENSSILIVYRGQHLSFAEIFSLRCNIEKKISTNGFLSTSRSKLVAKKFISKRSKRSDVESVLFEIHIDTRKMTTPLADISEYSKFPSEKEILFDLGATFTIDHVYYDEKESIWLIKLSSVSEEDLIDDIENFLRLFNQPDNDLLLAEIMEAMGHYKQCREYLENNLNLHENRGYIYQIIGLTYYDEEYYDQAIGYLTKASDWFASLNHWIEMIKVTNYITDCYRLKNDESIAEKTAIKALEILKSRTNLPENSCLYASIKRNLALTKNIQVLRQHLLEAVKIYKNPSKTCQCIHHDINIASTYAHLADTYLQEKQFVQTLEYLQKSEELRKNHLVFWRYRKTYADCLMVLMAIFRSTGNVTLADEYQIKYIKFLDNHLIEAKEEFYTLAMKQYILTHKSKGETLEYLLIHETSLLKLFAQNSSNNRENIIKQHVNIGKIYCQTKDYRWANKHFNEADSLCENIPLKEKQAQIFFNMAYEVYLLEKDFGLKIFQKLLIIQLEIFSKDDLRIAFTHYYLSTLLHQHEISMEYIEKAIEIFEKHINDKETYQLNIKELLPSSYDHLGYLNSDRNNWNKSLECFSKSSEIYLKYFDEIINNYYLLANSYQAIAKIYQHLLNVDLSIEFYLKYLETNDKYIHSTQSQFVTKPKSEYVLNTMLSLGKLFLKKKDYKQSENYFEKYLQLQSDYKIVGDSYQEEEEFEKAIEYYQKSINLVKNQPDQYADCLFQMSICYEQINKNQIDNAIDCILKSIDLCKKFFNDNKLALGYRYLLYAEILTKKNLFDQAFNIANQILEFQLNDQLLLTCHHLLFSECYYQKEQYQLAFEQVKLSLEIYPQRDDKINLNIYKQVVLCSIRLNDFDQALIYCFKIRTILDQLYPIVHRFKGILYSTIALIYSKQYQLKESNEYSQLALDIYEELITNKENINSIGEMFENLGELYADQKNLINAKKFYQKALEYFQIEFFDDHPVIQRIKIIIQRL